MELEIPKSEVINSIFKDKTTDRNNLIITTQNNNKDKEKKKNENIQNNDNDRSPISINNKDQFKKRRQGLWLNNINLLQKEEEKIETPTPVIQEEIKEDKIKRKRDNIIKHPNRRVGHLSINKNNLLNKSLQSWRSNYENNPQSPMLKIIFY